MSERQKFIVRMRGVALKFHRNLCGAVYSVVKDEEATVFATVEDAATAMFVFRVPRDYCEVVEVLRDGRNGTDGEHACPRCRQRMRQDTPTYFYCEGCRKLWEVEVKAASPLRSAAAVHR
jgi:hypothetical protein